jgi:uncharacterized membrane protein YvlD (DUF360 family)
MSYLMPSNIFLAPVAKIDNLPIYNMHLVLFAVSVTALTLWYSARKTVQC